MEEKQEQPRIRRKNFTADELAQMKQMDSEGKSRAEIAKTFDCDRSAITRRLGAKRRYRDRRVPEELSN